MKKEAFWGCDPFTRKFTRHEGERWLWGGRVFFVYQPTKFYWYVVEAVTGLRVCGESYRTRRDALAAAEKKLEKYKDEIEGLLEASVARSGRSPWKGGDGQDVASPSI